MVWTVSLWLGSKGRDRVRRNLTEEEQSEFWALAKKSKGRPSALPQRDRTRMKSIVGKAIRGELRLSRSRVPWAPGSGIE
jgi:hypothetical protein